MSTLRRYLPVCRQPWTTENPAMEIRKLPGVFTHLAFLLLIVSLTTQASAQARSFLLIDGRTLNITSYQGGNIQGSVTPISVTIPIRPIHPVLTEWLQHALAGDMKPRSLEIVLLDPTGLITAAQLLGASVLSQFSFSALDTRIQTPVYSSFTFNPVGVPRPGASGGLLSESDSRQVLMSTDFIVEFRDLGLHDEALEVFAVSSITWQNGGISPEYCVLCSGQTSDLWLYR